MVLGDVVELGGVVVLGDVELGEVVLGETPVGEFPVGTQGVVVLLVVPVSGMVELVVLPELLGEVVDVEGLVVELD